MAKSRLLLGVGRFDRERNDYGFGKPRNRRASRVSHAKDVMRFWDRLDVSISVCVALFLLSVQCQSLFYHPNPRLRLLHSSPDGSAFDAKWTPDGEGVYYLLTRHEYNIRHFGGALWRIAADGSGNHEVLNDTFCALAVSPDGGKLALAYGSPDTGGKLILVDTSGRLVDSLPEITKMVADVEFGEDGNALYYFALNDGFYRFHLDTRVEDTVLLRSFDLNLGFDVYGDSLLISPWFGVFNMKSQREDTLVWELEPRFKPDDPNGIISASDVHSNGYDLWSRELTTVNVQTGDTLNLDAGPYRVSVFSYPSWSPDGNSILFSGARMNLAGHTSPEFFELWILPR